MYLYVYNYAVSDESIPKERGDAVKGIDMLVASHVCDPSCS
ncbi:hypothetical protein [Francisella sp. 19X1-34]|nr:hypothetical protein [Francisella sp. 19X1-34]MED7787835.1 hypothetical protein [Francisella sp. 19X1-34]